LLPKYRITTSFEGQTNIITSITVCVIGGATILVIMCVIGGATILVIMCVIGGAAILVIMCINTFKTDVFVFIGSVIICLMSL
jgi:hypothetical protein